MQQFVVPQFIDVEDKIIGPITTRQFLILLAGGLLLFIEFKLTDFTLFIFEGLITLVICGAFAFLKVNGMPIHYFVVNLLQTMRRPRLRVWGKETGEGKAGIELAASLPATPKVSRHAPLARSRLTELSLVVDTGGVYKPDDESQ